jgi:hypothetical protein
MICQTIVQSNHDPVFGVANVAVDRLRNTDRALETDAPNEPGEDNAS